MSFSANHDLEWLQSRRGLYCDSPTWALHCIVFVPLTLPKTQNLLGQMLPVARLRAHGLDQMQCSFLLSVLFKAGSLLYLVHELEQFSQVWMSDSQNPTATMLLILCEGSRCNLHLFERGIPACPYQQTLKNFTESFIRSPEGFSLEHMWCTQASRELSPLAHLARHHDAHMIGWFVEHQDGTDLFGLYNDWEQGG